MPVPPLEEQRTTVAHISEETAKLDTLSAQLRVAHWGWGGCRGRHPSRAGKIFRRSTRLFPETVLAPARRESFPTSWAKLPLQGGFGPRLIDRQVNFLQPNKKKHQRIMARMPDRVSLLPFGGYACAGAFGGWLSLPLQPPCVYPDARGRPLPPGLFPAA